MSLTLCPFGCVATTTELMEHLKQDSVMDVYQLSRDIVRVRRGLYACAHLNAEQLAALRCGGVLDCVSALDAEGVDVAACGVELSALHVRFRRGDHWARSRIAEAGVPVVAHWHEWRTRRRDALTNREEYRSRRPVVPLYHVPPAEALAQALVCVPPEQALRLIAAIEAEAMLSRDRIERIVAISPRRTQQALRRASAGSGMPPSRHSP